VLYQRDRRRPLDYKSATEVSTVNRRTIVAICLAAVVAPRAAHALSIACSPPEERYLFECNDRVCVPLFRATPVKENACEWRLVIEPIERWASDALLAEAGRREIPMEGVLQVSIHRSLVSPDLKEEHWIQIENSTVTTRQESPEAVQAEWEARYL